MVSKTQDLNGRANTKVGAAQRGPARLLARDVIQLVELQLELLRADVGAAAHAARLCALLTLVAGTLLIAAIPLLLFAIAAWLESSYDWSRAASMAVVGAGGIVISGGLLLAARSVGKKGVAELAHSREECKHNLAWLKKTLISDDPASPPRPEYH